MSNIETPLSPEIAARELIAQFRAIRQSIPGFVLLSPGAVKRMVPAASVPDVFLTTVGTSVDRSDLLRAASRLPAAAYPQVVLVSSVYRDVLAEGDELMRGIREMVLSDRYDVSQEALRMYGVSQRFNRPADREQLVPYITAMRDALGRSRSKPIEAPDDDPPNTTPPTGNGNGNGGNK